MDGKRFDALIKGLGSRRLTRLRVLQGMAAATAVGMTGITLATDGTDAADRDRRDRRRQICHCGDNNPEQINCVTKRLPRRRARRHLRRHEFDYKGKCVEPAPIGGSCLSLPPEDRCPGEVCCGEGTKKVGTCKPNVKACG